MLLCFGQVQHLFSQETQVTGHVTDGNTGEPLAFVGISFLGHAGARVATDFEGNFTIKTNKPVDSLRVYLVGFEVYYQRVKSGQPQHFNIQLVQAQKELTPAVFKAKANPAHRIFDSLIAHKKFHSPDNLDYYECENFNKTELAVNNISAALTRNRLTKKLGVLFDTASTLLVDSGRLVLPVFVSESVTDFYYKKNPHKIKDHIKATRVNGIGVEDGSLVSQMTGTLFQTYNFYEDWVTVLMKQFPTPVNDNYRKYYYLKIIDSSGFIEGRRIYQIQLKKKHKNDLSFSGTIWIEDSTFAIKQMVLEVDRSANLNFIEKIKFQQEFSQTSAGPWLPSKTRISVDIDQFGNKTSGVVAKFYLTSRNIKVNEPHEGRFYERQISVADTAQRASEAFWVSKHQQSGVTDEQVFFNMVDSIKKLPVIKSYVDYASFLFGGYKRIGKVDWGPYLLLYNNNVVEGHRFRLGAATNYKLSNKHFFAGYLAYGTKDQRLKYDLTYEEILSRKKWLKLGASYRDDNEAIGLTPADNSVSGGLFSALSLFTNISRWGKCKTVKIYSEWAPFETLTARTKLEYKTFNPTGNYSFAYTNGDGKTMSDFQVLSAQIELRYAAEDVFIQNDFNRINVGSLKKPAYNLLYTKGFMIPGFSSFDYHKIRFSVRQHIYFRRFGVGLYQVSAFKFFNRAPYPLLDVQAGNQSFIYNPNNYNLMRFAEFVADESYSGYYEHNFEGAFLNRIKGIRNWKLRLFANARGVWGRIHEENWNLTPAPYEKYSRFTNHPYIELGYGVENIFRLLRVDFVHRLNYLSSPGARPFGVFLSIQLKL